MEQIKENKMGYQPMNKLLISMSLPMMISMLVQALYNVVDSIFVSRIGGPEQTGLTAVSLAFPIQNLMIAVGVGTGVGINALLSRSLGEKKMELVNKSASNGLFLAFINYILFAIIGLFFSRTFYISQVNTPSISADVRNEIISMGTDYMTVITVFSFGLFFQITLERFLQSTGKTIYNMITQGLGAIINIILDPILIFGYFGFPKLGVLGAAIATVTGQWIAMFLGIYLNIKKNNEIKISFKNFRPDTEVIRKIYSVGLPSIIMQAIGSVMTYGMNKILIAFSDTAVSLFGVYFKLQSFVFMPVFGLNNGMVPIVAYNYGAQKRKRIISAIKLALCYALGLMLIGFLIFQLFPQELLSLFHASDKMIEIGVPALRIISLSFLLAGISIVSISTFQALNEGMPSLVISVCRQLLVILPVAYFFGKWFGVSKVWYAFPIAEIVALSLSLIFFVRIYRRKIKKIREE